MRRVVRTMRHTWLVRLGRVAVGCGIWRQCRWHQERGVPGYWHIQIGHLVLGGGIMAYGWWRERVFRD